jgi:succinylglutamate desuccinylase
MFDPQDDLYKLNQRFDQHAVQQMASQISQISMLLQRYNNRVYSAVEDISRQIGRVYLESMETSRHLRKHSELLEKLASGALLFRATNENPPAAKPKVSTKRSKP